MPPLLRHRPGAPHPAAPDCHSCALQGFCPADGGCPVERRYRLAKGDHLFHMDDAVRPCIYLVRSGCLKLYQLNQDGVQRIIDFPGPGRWLGADDIGAPRRHACALALNACEVDAVPYGRLMAMLERQPRSAELFGHMLSRDIARQQRLLAILRSSPAERRVAHFLLDRAGPAPAAGRAEAPAILPMSRQDIGDYLGLTPSTVSRVLSAFRQRGWVALRLRGFLLLARDSIAQLANLT